MSRIEKGPANHPDPLAKGDKPFEKVKCGQGKEAGEKCSRGKGNIDSHLLKKRSRKIHILHILFLKVVIFSGPRCFCSFEQKDVGLCPQLEYSESREGLAASNFSPLSGYSKYGHSTCGISSQGQLKFISV